MTSAILSVALAFTLLIALLPAARAQGERSGDRQRDDNLGQDAAVADLPGKQWALHDLSAASVERVCKLTGEDSLNKTLTRFGIWGVDLGSMAQLGDTVYMFGGDTFSSPAPEYAGWRSNVLFKIRDDDPSDGLTIAQAVHDGNPNYAKECLYSLKNDGVQKTVIPTNLFAAGETLYCIYMSVAHWSDSYSVWETPFSGLAKSTDYGQTWKKLKNVMWPGDSNFIQTANCQVGDTMYFWGIPGGRWGGAALMKAPVDKLEDFESYAYYTGQDADGAPQWAQGSAGIYQAKLVLQRTVGELCVNYNPYLGNFVVTYLDVARGQIVMREGVTPWGPWGEKVDLHIADGSVEHHHYGAFMHPKYVEENGRVFYFAMSQFWPVYNIFWMKATLP